MENCCGTDLNFRSFSPTFQYSKGGLTLKNVSNTCEPEFAKRTKDKKVLKPPFSTAGPIFCKAFLLRSIFVPIKKITTLEPSFPKIKYSVPWDAKNSWAMWAGQSTQRPILMIRLVDETVSMVSPRNTEQKEDKP